MSKPRVKLSSTVDVKALIPSITPHPFCELEYIPADRTLNLWEGRSFDHCECRWERTIAQARQLAFEIPGVPYHFILVSGKIYYRKNGE